MHLAKIFGAQYYYAFSSVTVTFLWLPEGYKEARTQEDKLSGRRGNPGMARAEGVLRAEGKGEDLASQ